MEGHDTKPNVISCVGVLKEVPAVNFDFPLLSFSFYITFKSEIADAGEHIPLEKGRFGECNSKLLPPGHVTALLPKVA